MKRVVLDTNVMVSAMLVPVGTQALVLLLALRGDVTLCVSRAVLDEYAEVLRRPRFKLSPQRVDKLLADIRKLAEFIEPTQTLAVSSDEADNRLLRMRGSGEGGLSRHWQHSPLPISPQDDQDIDRQAISGAHGQQLIPILQLHPQPKTPERQTQSQSHRIISSHAPTALNRYSPAP